MCTNAFNTRKKTRRTYHERAEKEMIKRLLLRSCNVRGELVGSISSTFKTHTKKNTHNISSALFFLFVSENVWVDEKKRKQMAQNNKTARIRNKLNEILYVLIIGSVCELTFQNLPIETIASEFLELAFGWGEMEKKTMAQIACEMRMKNAPTQSTAKCSWNGMVWRHGSAFFRSSDELENTENKTKSKSKKMNFGRENMQEILFVWRIQPRKLRQRSIWANACAKNWNQNQSIGQRLAKCMLYGLSLVRMERLGDDEKRKYKWTFLRWN